MSTDDLINPASKQAEWINLSGASVEILLHGKLYRSGRVDCTMADGSGIWLAADGNTTRELIWLDEGYSLRRLEARKKKPQSMPASGEIS